MAACILFCAADCDGTLLRPIQGEDYIIAADGGLRHTQRLGLEPDAIIGDFDSLGYIPQGARVFPVQKDDTDAMLALRHGLSLGYREFFIYGGLDGPRLDHTVANFQALQFLCSHGASGYLVGSACLVTVVQNGAVHFPAGATGTLSVFCLGPDAQGVTLQGLQYPLQDHTLTADFPLGVSNHFIGSCATVSVRSGSLLVLWDRANGLPQRELFP